MEGGGDHRRSKSAPTFEGIRRIEKSKTSGRLSPENASNDNNGSSSAGKVAVERGQSSTERAPQSPKAKYLADRMFREDEPKSSSPSGMARLVRLEGLSSLWNNKQKAKLPSINIEPDKQPRGCLFPRRTPTKKQQFSEVSDEPEEASHFVNHRLSSKWRASSSTSEMGPTRQKIDTKHLSFGELIDLKPEDSEERLMNYERELDSMNASQRASTSASRRERMDGTLVERYGAHTSRRISITQGEDKKKKKEKDVFPRRIVFPRSDLRIITTAEGSGSSSSHLRGNIPDFRRMKENMGAGTSRDMSLRTSGSHHDAESPRAISIAARNIAREVRRQLEDARDENENEDERYPGFGLNDARRSNANRESGIFTSASRNSLIDDNEWGRHQGNEGPLETLKITRTFRDSDLDDDDSRVLRRVIVIPERCNNFSSPRLGTDNRSSILGGASSSSSPWSSSRSRLLPPSEDRVHRRDTRLNVSDGENQEMRRDPLSRARSRAVRGYPTRDSFLASRGSTSRSRMPLPFPPMRIMDRGTSLEATFEIPRESNVEDFSLMVEREEYGGDPVHDIMVDTQEIATLPSETSALHPRHLSEDTESSGADDEVDFSVPGLLYGPLEEGSPSFDQLEAESLFLESFSDADFASPTSSVGIPYVEDASFISENFERISAELNELRTRLNIASSSAESWEDWYTVDVLIQSSCHDFGFDTFPIMWQYPDHPINPALFNTLEKKYGDDSRSERLLLFDRINSTLSEIFQQHVALRPWLMPKLRLLPIRARERTDDAVEDLIGPESTHLQIIERILLTDMQWIDPVEEFASLGKELEELLLDDIIDEFVCDFLV